MGALVPLALFLFLLVPGHPFGLIGGLPWPPLSLGLAVLLPCLTFAGWPPPRDRWSRPVAILALLVCGVKLALALIAPRYGLEASYFANDRFNNEPESSTMAAGTPYTRLDTVLDFGSDEFPLFFFNDSERFNSLGPDRLDRGRTLTWSVRWNGYLQVNSSAPFWIWLTASGPGELALDGFKLLKVDAEGRDTAGTQIQLEQGPHYLEIRYARKRERSGYLRVESDLGGQRVPLAAPRLTADAESAERVHRDELSAVIARGVDSLWLGLLVVWASVALATYRRRSRNAGAGLWATLERPLLALVPLAFWAQAALPRLDRVGKMVFLGGGQDWLTHETLARDIQFNGPLMTLGKPLGQGALYYAQPFYPYYLALLHTLAGEDLFGVIALQMTGLGLAVVLLYLLTRELFGRLTAVVNLFLMLGVLVPFEFAWVTRLLISEALYYWLMPAAVLALVLITRSPSAGLAILTGTLLGLACITRGPTLLYVPAVLIVVFQCWRRARLHRSTLLRSCLLLTVSAGFVISLVPLRNLIVAGRPVLTASSGGVNLEKLHRPSRGVRLDDVTRDPLYEALGLDQPTREVIEYARQDPTSYFGSYLPLAAYTLGFGFALNDVVDERPVQFQPELLALDLLYILALVLVPGARTGRAMLLHALIGIHFLTMVVFAPYDYENRLVTPMYLFVGVIGAAGLAELMRRFRPSVFTSRVHRPAMDVVDPRGPTSRALTK